MLTKKIFVAVLMGIGTVAFGAGVVLPQNLGIGKTATSAPAQLQIDGPIVGPSAQVQVETGSTAASVPAQLQDGGAIIEPQDRAVSEVGSRPAATQSQLQVEELPLKTPNQVLDEPGVAAPEIDGSRADGDADSIYIVVDLVAQLSTYPQEYVCYLDTMVVVMFAYPDPTIDWAGFAFITDISSASEVTLSYPHPGVNEDGSPLNETGDLVQGQRLIIQRDYRSDAAKVRLEAILADGDLIQRIISGPQECWEVIPEPSVREAIRMGLLGGQPEVVPGYGGFYRDPDDRGSFYVYMLDVSQQQEARRALEMILWTERVARDVREVRVVEGQYSMSQLSHWYYLARRMSHTEGRVMSDLVESKNRIAFGVQDQEAQSLIEAELDRLGIPQEVVVFKIMTGSWVLDTLTSDSPSDPVVGAPK